MRRKMEVDGVEFPVWSRHTTKLVMLHHVESPGLSDDGAALPFITGRGANLDGEAVEYSAKYAARNGLECDRIILMVISDGLPAGADDEMLEGLHLQRTVERVARAGIEVYGIGIGITDGRANWRDTKDHRTHRECFAAYYPDRPSGPGRAATGHILIPPEGLTDTVLRELVALIAREVGFSKKGLGR
jgi:hypothetical protein